MSLHKLRQDWDELARVDPCWAVLTDLPRGQGGAQDLDAFFHSGEVEIAAAMRTASTLGYPVGRALALDFGCGLGRLTRALAAHFERCVGVDISASMIEQARRLNESLASVEFVLNADSRLAAFSDAHFDFIYSARVLQHLPGRPSIEGYLSEFLRLLKPGGLLVFQLPSHIPLRKRIQPRRRVYALLRGLGVNEEVLYGRLGLTPMRMAFIPREQVVALLEARGATCLAVEQDDKCGPVIESMTYYATGASAGGG